MTTGPVLLLAAVAALAVALVAAVPGANALNILVTRNTEADVEFDDDFCTYEFDDVEDAGLPSFEALAAAGIVALLFLGRPDGCLCCDCLNACAPVNIVTKGLYAVAIGVAVVRASGAQYTTVSTVGGFGSSGQQFAIQLAAETNTLVVRLEVPDESLAADTVFTVGNDDNEAASFDVSEENVATGQYFVQAVDGEFNSLVLGADGFELNYGISQISWRCDSRRQDAAVKELRNEVKRKTDAVRQALTRTAKAKHQPEGVAVTLTSGATLASTFADTSELHTLDFAATERAGTIAAHDLPRASVADVAVQSDPTSLTASRTNAILSLIDAPANRFTIVAANAGGVTSSLRAITTLDTYVITFARTVSAVYIELVTGVFAVTTELAVSVANGINNTPTELGTEPIATGINSNVLAIVAPEGEVFDRVRLRVTVAGTGLAGVSVSLVSITTRDD